MAAEVPRGLRLHGWSKRRASTNSVRMEMERFSGKAKEDQGASALVLDLAKAFEPVTDRRWEGGERAR